MYQLGHNPVSFGKDYGLDYGKKNGGFLYHTYYLPDKYF